MGPPRSRPVTVLTVDDQSVFLRATRKLLAATDGFEQVGEASSGAQALALAAEARPDVVLLDVRLPGEDGIDVAHRIADLLPEALVILMSVVERDDLPPFELEDGLVHVRKQDLSIRRLCDLWTAHASADRPA